MLVKAGQIIAIDSVIVDPTLSGDGVKSPLGVKAVAPTVSGHAGLSAENVNNTVYIGMEPDAVKVVSTNKSVSIEKTVKSDGTVEYNLGVSAKPIVSDTNIIGTNGISAQETAPATYTIGVSGNYVKSEALNDYYTKNEADTNFQTKGNYVKESDLDCYYKKTDIDAYSAKVNSEFNETSAWAMSEFQPKSEMSAYYKKSDVYTKSEVDAKIPSLVDYALSADVKTAIATSEDWAEDTFQVKGSYASATDITSLSSTVDTKLAVKANKSYVDETFQVKGNYVTSADNELSGKALVLKDNKWEEAPEGTVYTSGPNIKINGNSISGRDWSPELAEKANTSALEGLATQDDLDELNDAIAKNLVEALDATSAWAKETFQLSGDYLTNKDLEDYYIKSEVDGKIEELSATIDRDFATKTELAEKLDESKTTNWDVKEYSAGNNYITIQNHKISGKDWSTEIDAKQDKLTDKQLSAISSVSAIQSISGDWATKTEVNTLVDNKVEELSATVSRDYLKKADVKEYSAGDNIDITNYVISSKDWTPELDTKVNNTDFNTYSASTKTQIDSKVNNADFTVYSATVNRQISDKLDKSEFDTYSADIDSQLSTLYYKKSETSGANEISTGLGKKVDLPTSQQTGKLVYNATNKTWEAAPSEFDGVVTADSLSGNGTAISPLGLNTANFDPNKQYAWSTEGWKEVAAQSNLFAGTDLKIVNNVVQVNTNGIANSAGSAFVEGIDTVASGIASHAAGKNTSAYSDYSFVEGYQNTDYLITGLIGANHTEGAYNQVSGVYSHIEGHANTLTGYGVHMEGGYNIFKSHNLTADKSDPIGRWNIWGQSIEGMANATTAEPTSGTEGVDFGYVHGGILKVIGNGTRTKTDDSKPESEVITRSDALILYRDGSMMVKGSISANGVELGNYTPTLPLNIYGTTANTVANNSIGAIGNKCDVGTKSIALSYLGASAYSNSMAMGDDTFASADSFAAGWGVSAINTSFAAGNGVIANRHGVIFGNGNASNRSIADNYSISVGDAVFAYNFSQAFGRGLVMSGSTDASQGFGGMVIGGWNKTSADALFVIGNGTNSDAAHRSDALVLTRDGKLTTNKVFVSGTNFDTLGQSRLDGNNACYGTNWMGVSESHAGFLKFIDGQNAGDTEISNASSGIQIEFKPNTTQGDLSIINTCTGTQTVTKVINVPTASYTNMSTFDFENGPNYMLRKTANGFDIGAAVINTTALPANVQANAYYFIYEM